MSTVKLGSSDEDFFKNYDRKFIQLSRNIAILIHIFEKDKDHSWEDIWLHDLTGVYEKDYNLLIESAEQLIKQLEGHYCRAFLSALRDVCDKEIKADLERINKLKENENSSDK